MEIDFNQLTQGGLLAFLVWITTYSYPKIIEYLRERRADKQQQEDNRLREQKQQEDIKKSNTEQAMAIYTVLINGLKSDIDALMGKLDILHREHASCREENATLRAEVRSLTERIEQLEKRA